MLTMGFLNIALTTLLLAFACWTGEGALSDCGQAYAAQLQYLLTLKEDCDVAGFHDCCQVYI